MLAQSIKPNTLDTHYTLTFRKAHAHLILCLLLVCIVFIGLCCLAETRRENKSQSNIHDCAATLDDLRQLSTQQGDCLDDASFNLRAAIERIRARNAYLTTKNTDVSQWRLGGAPAFHKEFPRRRKWNQPPGSIVSLMAPVYTCPWTFARTNLVSTYNFDGGKWTCGLDEMHKQRTNAMPKCIVYSFGSNNDDFFEHDVKKRAPSCEIHIFDPTSGKPPKTWGSKYYFHAWGLCLESQTSFKYNGTQFPCRGMRSSMKSLGHDHVDIFKMDVEGLEWGLMATEDWSQAHIGQLLVELHFPQGPRTFPALMRKFWIPLERAGYFLINLEPVSASSFAYEAVFLNVNWTPTGILRHVYTSSDYPNSTGVKWDSNEV